MGERERGGREREREREREGGRDTQRERERERESLREREGPFRVDSSPPTTKQGLLSKLRCLH